MNNACDGWRFTQIRGSLGGGRRDVGASEPERGGVDGLDGLDEPPGAWMDGWHGEGEGREGGASKGRGVLTLMELGRGCVKDRRSGEHGLHVLHGDGCERCQSTCATCRRPTTQLFSGVSLSLFL